MNIARLANKIVRTFNRHLPNILTISGVIGIGVTIHTSIKAVSQIDFLMADIKNSDESDEIRALTIDVVKKAAVPTLCWLATTSAIVASNRLAASRINQLACSYHGLKHDYINYKLAAASALGVEGKKKIDKFLDQKIIEERPESSSKTDNTFIFVDRFTKETFRSTMSEVTASLYALNRAFSMRGYVSIDEYCDLLGIAVPDAVKNFGWDYDLTMSTFRTSWIDFIVEPQEDGYGNIYYTITMLSEPEPDGYESYDWIADGYNELSESYLADDRDAIIGKINLPFDKD